MEYVTITKDEYDELTARAEKKIRIHKDTAELLTVAMKCAKQLADGSSLRIECDINGDYNINYINNSKGRIEYYDAEHSDYLEKLIQERINNTAVQDLSGIRYKTIKRG